MTYWNLRLALGVLLTGLTGALHAQQPPAPATQTPAAPLTTGTAGPKIEFDQPIYEFGKITAGEMIKHTFYFTNTGDQVLELTDVHPSCGCTTAGDWSKKVEPGQTGSIPLQVNTANFNGPVIKTVTVTCNAKPQPNIVLQLKGTIFWPIEIAPSFVVLSIPPDSPKASTTVRIINHMDEPLTLSTPESTNAAFTAELKPTKEGREFELKISSLASFGTGGLQAYINLKTSLTNKPVLTVPFVASVQPVVSAMPPVVMLPVPPLAAKTPATVTFQNNSTNHLILSDAVIEPAGAEVELKEVSPGHYTASLSFPPGFELTPGQSGRLRVKSSDARQPMIDVPIMQPQRPATPKPANPPVAGTH